MNLVSACNHILNQLTDLITRMSEEDFSKPSEALGKSTIGQHIRHTLEFFICFECGAAQGIINYDKRAHDKLIESDKFLALNAVRKISEFVNTLDHNLPLKLEVGYDLQQENFITIETNVMRELVYNIEHAVHHMAI